MDLPAGFGKFAKALTGFAIVNILLRVVLIIFFWNFDYAGLFFYTLFSLVIWLIVFILTVVRHQNAAFIVGMADLVLFSYSATITTGVEGGFYLLLVAAIPLNFYNTAIKKRKQLFGGILLVLSIIALVVLMRMEIFDAPYDHFKSDVFFAANLIGVSIMLALIGFLFGLVDQNEEKERMLTHQRIVMMANTDPLTNLINRRIMTTKIEHEKELVNKGGKPFSLVMVDVDNFKQINDVFGHDGGDFVLINLAHLIGLCLRKSDQVSRWGGDEFLVMLPETAGINGQMVAEKIKNRIAHTPFIYHEEDIPVTVTLGVSECDFFTGVDGTIRKADQALYQGKHGGKDQVVLTR
jgi:diguanylate cyclase (GGDEF)-like protein